MSTTFEIFPTKKIIPEYDEIIKCSVGMMSNFFKKENISYKIEASPQEVTPGDKIDYNVRHLLTNEDNWAAVNINDIGTIYIFYYKLTDIDREIWNDELQTNKNAQGMKEKIDASIEVGYYWQIKRTVGQPVIASLYYGYLAIAIAKLTDGIIYSDDGAWEYSCFPTDSESFEKIYLNIHEMSDISFKDTIVRWVESIRNGTSEK